jgi:hypothetical protein
VNILHILLIINIIIYKSDLAIDIQRDISGQLTSSVNLRSQSTSELSDLCSTKWLLSIFYLAHFSILHQPADFGGCRPTIQRDVSRQLTSAVNLGSQSTSVIEWLFAVAYRHFV